MNRNQAGIEIITSRSVFQVREINRQQEDLVNILPPKMQQLLYKLELALCLI